MQVVAALDDLQHLGVAEETPDAELRRDTGRAVDLQRVAADRKAASLAYIFAMLVSLRARSPRCSASAVERTSSRVVSTPTAMSVILDWTIWKSAMTLSNTSRT